MNMPHLSFGLQTETYSGKRKTKENTHGKQKQNNNEVYSQ